MDLYLTYKLAQTGDEEAILKLYKMFLPKIKKCGRNLDYDTAETDITIRFLEFMMIKVILRVIAFHFLLNCKEK